ncbi:MAG: hypothetical protein K0S93_62 [Nitrososphaeraceae archaeon]|jgi:hypothetical protein|nr:hypothetical protein [Nitrososphaeraceae archaeon]
MKNLDNLVIETKQSINQLNSLLEQLKPLIKKYSYCNPEYNLLRRHIEDNNKLIDTLEELRDLVK